MIQYRLLFIVIFVNLLLAIVSASTVKSSQLEVKPGVYNLQQLSEFTERATGTRVKVDTPLDSCVLYVQCEPLPIEAFWGKVALAVDATVERGSSYIRLFLSDTTMRLSREEDSKSRLRGIESYLSDVQKEVASALPVSIVANQTAASLKALINDPVSLYRTIKLGGITSGVGATHLLKQLLSTMSATSLLRSFSHPQFFVYEESGITGSFTKNQLYCIREYLRYIHELRSQINIPEDIPEWERGIIYELIGAASYEDRSRTIVLSIVARGRRIMANVSCYSPSGKKIDGSTIVIDTGRFSDSAAPNKEMLALAGKVDEMSEESNLYSMLCGAYISPEQWVERGSAVREMGDKIVLAREDISSAVVSSVFKSCFEEASQNVILPIPDSWIEIWGQYVRDKAIRQREYLEKIARDIVTLEADQEWLVFSLRNMAVYASDQFSRTSLHKFLESVRRAQRVRLEDYALMAWENSKASFDSRICSILRVLSESYTGHRIQATGPYEAFAVIGSASRFLPSTDNSAATLNTKDMKVRFLLTNLFAFGADIPARLSDLDRAGCKIIAGSKIEVASLHFRDREELVIQNVVCPGAPIGYPYYAESVQNVALILREVMQAHSGDSVSEHLHGLFRYGRRLNRDLLIMLQSGHAVHVTWVDQAVYENNSRGVAYEDLPDEIRKVISPP